MYNGGTEEEYCNITSMNEWECLYILTLISLFVSKQIYMYSIFNREINMIFFMFV